jgi:hypothetical protein
MVTSDRIAEYRRITRSVAAWAASQQDIAGVAVVGSWARKLARLDSDVDFVVLTDDKELYLSDGSWVPAAVGGPAEFVRTQAWGPLTEWRIALPSGLEVEFGFVPRSWASADPVDAGTARVVGDGCSPLVDPEGAFRPAHRSSGCHLAPARRRYGEPSETIFGDRRSSADHRHLGDSLLSVRGSDLRRASWVARWRMSWVNGSGPEVPLTYSSTARTRF